jgi:hypothetical protein
MWTGLHQDGWCYECLVVQSVPTVIGHSGLYEHYPLEPGHASPHSVPRHFGMESIDRTK